MNMLTIYARKEPTLDKQVWHLKKQKMDVALYKNKDTTGFYGLLVWHMNDLTKRNKHTEICGLKYKIEWLPDLKERVTFENHGRDAMDGGKIERDLL
jgi:phage pi2 protein 07